MCRRTGRCECARQTEEDDFSTRRQGAGNVLPGEWILAFHGFIANSCFKCYFGSMRYLIVANLLFHVALFMHCVV